MGVSLVLLEYLSFTPLIQSKPDCRIRILLLERKCIKTCKFVCIVNTFRARMELFIFIFIYMLFISLVFYIYTRTKKVPPIAYIIMCLLSHRIHSIFILRLFNDPIAMLLLYASIGCFLNKWWRAGCIIYSLAVSVKMNVLLFAPGLFVILILSHGFCHSSVFQYR